MATNYFGSAIDVSWAKAVAAGKLKLPRAIPRAKAVAWIKSGSGGKIFACVVNPTRIKGNKRTFVCRHGVKVGTKGIGLSFDPVAKKLIVVYDMQKNAFRMIAIEGLKTITIRGKVYRVTG